MRIGQGRADLPEEGERLVGVEADLMDDLGEVCALDEFHDEEEMPLRGLPELMDGDDVRVVELGHGAGLAAEAVHEGGVHADLQREELDGDEAVERDLPGLEDRAHAAAPEHGEHFVAREKAGHFRDRRRLPAVRAGAGHLRGVQAPREHLAGIQAAETRRQRAVRRREGVIGFRHGAEG